MGRIILDVAVTLDGFISGPNGEIDWLVKDPGMDFGDILTEILEGVDAILYGRVSYDLWGNYRPAEGASYKLNEAYDLLHSKRKYVFSASQRIDDRAEFICSDIRENVIKLKEETKGDIWLYGGGKLITTMINLRAVDIFRLAVHPVVIGKGIRLFNDITGKVALELTELRHSKTGVVRRCWRTSQ